jgi:hypothetical protein
VALLLCGHAALWAQTLHPVTDEKDRYGYADEQGTVVIPCQYKDALPFQEGLARVQKGSKYGLMTAAGEFVLAPKYDEIGSFRHGIAKVRAGKKYGMVNTKGELVLPVKYTSIAPFRGGVAVVTMGKKQGLISQTGSLLLPVEYAAISPFNQYGKAWINKGGKLQTKGQLKDRVLGGKYGIVSLDKGVVVEPIYKTLGEQTDTVFHLANATFFSGMSYLEAPKSDCRYLIFNEKVFTLAPGLIGADGKELIPCNIYNFITYPASDMALIQKTVGEKRKDRQTFSGYRNLKSGQEVLLPLGFVGQPFIGNVALISKTPEEPSAKKEKNAAQTASPARPVTFTLIDKEGRVLLEGLDAVLPCKEGKMVVAQAGKYGVVDVQQARLTVPFGSFEGFKEGFRGDYIASKQNGKWGVIDQHQQTVVPFEYADLSGVQNGYYAATNDGVSWGLFDLAGKQVIPSEYADVRLPDKANPTHTWVKKDTLWYSYDLLQAKEVNETGYAWISPYRGGMAQASLQSPRPPELSEATKKMLAEVKTMIPSVSQEELMKQWIATGAVATASAPAQEVSVVSTEGVVLFPLPISSSVYEAVCRYIQENGGRVTDKAAAHRFLLLQTRNERNYPLTAIIPDTDWDY